MSYTTKVLKSCSNICMSIQMSWELQQLQSGKLNLGTPKFEEDKETPVPQGGMHSTILLYPIWFIFLCDKNSPGRWIVCCCCHPAEVCEKLSCSFAFQLAESRAGKALCGLLRAKLEWNVGFIPEEKVDRSWLHLRLLHSGRQFSSSAISDFDSNSVFQLVKK